MMRNSLRFRSGFFAVHVRNPQYFTRTTAGIVAGERRAPVVTVCPVKQLRALENGDGRPHHRRRYPEDAKKFEVHLN